MIFKFRIISSEKGDFVRDMEIRSDQSFYDFHHALAKNLHYDESQLASFFISNPHWEKGHEITLFDISEGTSPDIRIMDKTRIDALFNDTKQRLLYVFDFFNERILFIELVEIHANDDQLNYPRITFTKGSAPPQILIIDNNFIDPDLNE